MSAKPALSSVGMTVRVLASFSPAPSTTESSSIGFDSSFTQAKTEPGAKSLWSRRESHYGVPLRKEWRRILVKLMIGLGKTPLEEPISAAERAPLRSAAIPPRSQRQSGGWAWLIQLNHRSQVRPNDHRYRNRECPTHLLNQARPRNPAPSSNQRRHRQLRLSPIPGPPLNRYPCDAHLHMNIAGFQVLPAL